MFQCIGAGLGLDFGYRKVFAVFFFNLDFDRHAVAVPAGNVHCIETGHRPTFNDDVFKNFVNSMANMDVAICVGRPIMQNKFWTALAGRPDRRVDAIFGPLRDPLGFALGQIAAHGKRGVRQIKGLSIVHGWRNSL